MGKVADHVSIKSLFPTVFIARALFCFALRFIEDPSQMFCQVAIGGVFIISVVQYIMVQALFLKSLPGHIRGVMVAALYNIGNIS